mmetsp:Transcript_95081/g.301695  ORF Transcript_95081/g.301695 Transcript_95081/m.301695 type:complete len:603 (-) Transcript_95081:278-2086(-)
MDRLSRLSKQLLAAPVAAAGASPQAESRTKIKKLSEEEQQQVMQTLLAYTESSKKLVEDGTFPTMTMWDMLMATKHNFGVSSKEDARELVEAAAPDFLKAMDVLPGPWQDAKTMDDRVALVRAAQRAQAAGTDVFQYADWQSKYGDRGLSSNIVIPIVSGFGYGHNYQRRFIPRVILGAPADAERISRTHVRKEGNFEQVIYDSVLSTTDNDHWKMQRGHLSEVFLPLSSLAEILPTSLTRAKNCASRLAEAAAAGPVDMSDFLLHEAQAQLQLALLGAPQQLMDATNREIRAAFMGDLEEGRLGALCEAMTSIMEATRGDDSVALPSDGCPVRGPLSRAVHTSGLPASAAYGNMLLILFAGHDTTGHTMTWLLLEVARHPEIQNRLLAEVDAFFEHLGGRDPTYRDLGPGRLDLLDRCITETLRMWPAVASGTYRQLQFDDEVRGPNGSRVTLPRGTPVNIVNWSRHRNPDLWGPDVDEFNPDREFHSEEFARVGCPMAAKNPQSGRFSPFAHAPRSCLGRNFAQMEMRLILTQLLHSFRFSLAPPYDSLVGARTGAVPGPGEFHGVNRATMGPMDLESSTEHFWGTRHVYALKMNVERRR